MFDSINDIRKCIQEFRNKTGKHPNVIFIPKKLQLKFVDEFSNSPYMPGASPNNKLSFYDSRYDFRIYGVRIQWTNDLCGVDWLPQFEEKENIKVSNEQYESFKELNKRLEKIRDRDLCTYHNKPKEKKIKDKRRKIIL